MTDDLVRRADLYETRPVLDGLSYTLDPSVVLMGEMARSQAAVEFLDRIIQELSAQELLDAPEIVGLQQDGKAVAYQGPQALWDIWLQHRKQLAGVASQVIKLELKERALDQSMGQARLLFAMIQGLLADPGLGLSSVQRQALGRAIASRLREGDSIPATASDSPDPVSIQRKAKDGPDDVIEGRL